MCWLSGCVDDTTRYGSKDERMGSRYAAFTLLITSLCFALMGGVSGGVYCYSFPFSLSVSDIFFTMQRHYFFTGAWSSTCLPGYCPAELGRPRCYSFTF